MSRKKTDRTVHQADSRLEREIASRKPEVKMDENFRIGLRNELMAGFQANRPEKKEKTVSRGFFSRGWVRGMAGVMAVVVISAVTVYVNRYRLFISKQPVPSEIREDANALPEAKNSFRKESDRPVAMKTEKAERLKQAEGEKTVDELSAASEEQDVSSGKLGDDKGAMNARSQSAPAPETREGPMDQAADMDKMESTVKSKVSAKDSIAGYSMEKKTAVMPSTAVDYRFAGRPGSFAEIEKKLKSGGLPSRQSVKIDELVCEYSYGKSAASPEPLSVYTELASCPWDQERVLLFVLVQAGLSGTADIPVAENAVMKIRYSGTGPLQKTPSGSQYFLTVHSPEHASSKLSGTFMSGEQSSVIVELPVKSLASGSALAEGEVIFRKGGETVNSTVTFRVNAVQTPAEPASSIFRTAAAAMYWGKILSGSITADQAGFTRISRLLGGPGTKKNDDERNRLLEAVNLSRQLLVK